MLDDLNASAIADKNNEVLLLQKQGEISIIENELQDVLIASSNFNNFLHQFIGRDEISLKYNERVKGYNLIRKHTNAKAERLSEGEKTAIAFVYFLTKLGENDNRIENLTIVIDDPISSLDTQNLFNAYSFIISKLNNCHQLFILTHSFAFFKLLREKYKKNRDTSRNKVELYYIENIYTTKNDKTFREAKIIELPKSLKLLDSEYAFCFKCVKKIIEKAETLELDEFFTLSNYCRKILETFASFKIIGDNIDFKKKLEKLYLFSQNGETELNEENIIACENIYKFVNTFSHAINFDNNSEIDSLIIDAKIMANKILDLIKRVDEVHYNSLNNFDH